MAGAVEAAGVLFVELAAVVELLEEGLDDGDVAGVGGFDPAVGVDIEAIPEGAELGGDFRHVGLRGDAGFFGALLDLLAVLVDAGEEVDGLSVEPLEAGDGVRQDFFVGVADVGRAVGVVDGGSDEERLGHGITWRRAARAATGKPGSNNCINFAFAI